MHFKLAGAIVLMFCSSAYADDVQDTAAGGNQNVFGYFDLHGGVDFSTANFFSFGDPLYPGADWRSSEFGGAARASIELDQRFSLQGDIWANNYRTWASTTLPGAALHATFNPTARDQIGPFASIGGDYDVDNASGQLTRVYMTNFGVEWAHNVGEWRFYAQAGDTSNINGMVYIQGWDEPWQKIPVNNEYAVLVGTYFFKPNLALSGKIGASLTTSPGLGWTDTHNYEVLWGAKLEYQPEHSPLIGYIAYSGRANAFDDIGFGDGFSGNDIAGDIVVGIKLPFGQGTIQSLYQHAGLADLNPSFGDFTYRASGGRIRRRRNRGAAGLATGGGSSWLRREGEPSGISTLAS